MTTDKQAKASNKPTTKSKKLSPIEKELLEYYENCEPVLLHGDDPGDCRRELIKKVWLARGGIDYEEEYFDENGKLLNGEEIHGKLFKSLSDNTVKVPYCHTKSTERTWKRINCGGMNGKEVYKELVEGREVTSELEKLLELKDYSENVKGYLLEYKGLVFIDNLHCRLGNDEDDENYRKVAKIVEDRRSIIIDGIFPDLDDFPTFDWLVAYARNPDGFPDYFMEQFKLISLDRKVEEETIEIDHVRLLLKYKGEEAKVEPKQIELFELLWKNKDRVVKRNDIDKELWPETDNQEPTSPIQIEQQVNSLRDGLEELGFKRNIIKTYKKTQLEKEGAYEFHSNLTSFLKQS